MFEPESSARRWGRQSIFEKTCPFPDRRMIDTVGHCLTMSYNFAICAPPVPMNDSEAWERIDDFIKADGPPPPVFRWIHDELTARYPCICTLSDDRVDSDGVWSDGPLWNDFGHRVAVLGLIYSRVEEVLPFVIETATGLGLSVFDWGGPTIYRPATTT